MKFLYNSEILEGADGGWGWLPRLGAALTPNVAGSGDSYLRGRGFFNQLANPFVIFDDSHQRGIIGVNFTQLGQHAQRLWAVILPRPAEGGKYRPVPGIIVGHFEIREGQSFYIHTGNLVLIRSTAEYGAL